MPRAAWGLAVLLVACAAARPAAAQPAPLAPTGGPPTPQPVLAFDPSPSGQLPPEPSEVRFAPSTKPPPVLGAPVLGAPVRPADRDPPGSGPVTTASYPASGSFDEQPRRVGSLGAPAASGNMLPARVVEPAVRTVYTPQATDAVDDFLTKRSRYRDQERQTFEREDHASGKFGEK